MSKQFWGVLVVIVLIFVSIFVFSGHKSSSTTKSSSSATPTNHVEGTSPAGVSLVEYGDFECPYCEAYYPIIKQVQAEFANQITFQFRNFPLVSIHPNAFAGARAAEAAGLQGKYWEMHDALYDSTNWQVWSTSSDPARYFNSYAQSLGLNLAQFKSDFASSKVNDLINADTAAGNKLNIQGTPTFYLDGKQVTIAGTAAAFEKAINAELAKKGVTSTTGSTGSTSSTSTSPTTTSTGTSTPSTTTSGN